MVKKETHGFYFPTPLNYQILDTRQQKLLETIKSTLHTIMKDTLVWILQPDKLKVLI